MTSAAPLAERPTLRFAKWLWDRSARPDHSRDGFGAAVSLALEHVAAYDYTHLDHMLQEIAVIVGEHLRSSGIAVHFIATHRKTGRPRILIETDWGLREAIDCAVTLTPTPPPPTPVRRKPS